MNVNLAFVKRSGFQYLTRRLLEKIISLNYEFYHSFKMSFGHALYNTIKQMFPLTRYTLYIQYF